MKEKSAYGSYNADVRPSNAENEYEFKASRRLCGTVFKQCIAVLVILGLGILIHNSGNNFGNQCISALSDAVKFEFDFIGVFNGIRDSLN